MGEAERLWNQPKSIEAKLIELLNPVEPVVMRLQSLFVWEYPRRSVVLLVVVHLIFWCVTFHAYSTQGQANDFSITFK